MGDEEAFNQVFHAYVPRLHALIMKITKAEWIVKDIVQEVFLYLWIDREKLGEIETPQNWIFKIAYNRSYSWMARQAALDEKKGIIQQGTTENSLENLVSLHETTRLIQEAVDLLPAQAKLIFQLSRQSGLKASEVGDQLDISVQTVRNSLVRSVKFIKEHLAKHDIILPTILLYYLF